MNNTLQRNFKLYYPSYRKVIKFWIGLVKGYLCYEGNHYKLSFAEEEIVVTFKGNIIVIGSNIKALLRANDYSTIPSYYVSFDSFKIQFNDEIIKISLSIFLGNLLST